MSPLVHVPKWLAVGAAWVSLAYVAGSWGGIVQSPLDLMARRQAEVARQEAAVEAITERAQTAERAIYMLQWQQEQTQRDLSEVKATLNEMAMVLYSLERRSR